MLHGVGQVGDLLAVEFGADGVLLGGAGKFLRSVLDGLDHKLRNVVALHEVSVEARVFLWQSEGLVGLALFVEVCNVEASVVAIVASAAEDDPSAVARPGVITLRLVAVHVLQFS